MTDKPRCGLCVYNELVPVGTSGKCRRYPPSQLAGTITVGLYDWCGEFKHDEEKALQLKQKQENK